MSEASESLIQSLQDPENMRLRMGELTPEELLVAQSAVRYAITSLPRLGFDMVEQPAPIKPSGLSPR